MQELDTLIKTTRNLEKRLITASLGTWIFSALASVIQYRNFDIAFSTLATIFGGIIGTAAILSVYLGEIKHPSETVQHLLDFRPSFSSFATTLWLLISTGLFYLYYYFAKQSNEFCLLFYGVGIFLFIRTITRSASILQKSQQQKELWNSLSDEAKSEWFARKKKIEAAQKELSKTVSEANRFLEESKRKSKESRAEERAFNRKIFWQNVALKTRSFRKVLHLLTRDEIFQEDIAKRNIENRRKYWNPDFHRKNAELIASGKISPTFIEEKNFSYFLVEDNFRYFQVHDQINQKRAKHYADVFADSKNDYSKFTIAIVPEKTTITQEGSIILKDAHIHIFKYPVKEKERERKESA